MDERMYYEFVAVPHVDNNQPDKRWGDEVVFSELEEVVHDATHLQEYRQRVENAGRIEAARLRTAEAEQQ